MSARKSIINDINVTLEPLYLSENQGNGTLISFKNDNSGEIVDSTISTSDLLYFLNNKNTVVLNLSLLGFDYAGKSGYITSSDTILSALEKTQYQLDSIIISKGANNGIATLDSSGKLTTTQIPASLIGAMIYQGLWNASTNTPTLVSGVGTKGHYYLVSVGGNTILDTISSWKTNDWVVFSGTEWEKVDNSAIDALSVPLTGFNVGTDTDISSSDTILSAFQNTQGQINDRVTFTNSLTNYIPYYTSNGVVNSSTIYHSHTGNSGGSSTIINSNNTATESLTVNNDINQKIIGVRNDARLILRLTTLQINDFNNTESSAIYIGAGDNVYDTHMYVASRLTGTNDFISFYNSNVSLKTFWYSYNSELNLKAINNSNLTSILKLSKADNTQILQITNDGIVFGQSTKDVSSIIDLQTTSHGLGLPNLLGTQKTSITTSRKGLTVYDDTNKSLSFWNGTDWSSTLNSIYSGTTYAIPYFINNTNTLHTSTLMYGSTQGLLSLTDIDISDKTIFVINSFGSTDNFKVTHNYTTDKTTFIYNKLNQIVANLSDGDVKIGGTSHISSISSSSDHISFTDVATNINVWRTSNTGNTFIRTTDNTATNKFFTFTNFGGTQIGYIENGGMVIGSVARNTNLTLDLQSITQAVGLPVLTTLAENNISASGRIGMFLYNSDLSKLRYSNGVSWTSVIDSSFFSSLTTNYMPKWNGTSLVNSELSVSSGGDLTLFGTGNTNRMVFATSNSPTWGGIALQTSGGTDIWSLRTNPVGGSTSLSASGSMSIGGYAGTASVNMGVDLSSGRYISLNSNYDMTYSTATSKTTRVSSQYGTIIGPNLVSGGNLGQWYTNNSLSNSNALSVVGRGHFTTGIVIGGNTINSVTTLDLQSTLLGLGLPLVPSASLPTASTRKGNLLWDNTNNFLKISDGTNWNTVLLGNGLTTDVISKWDGTAFVDSLLTSRSGGLTLQNPTVIDLNTNGKSYFEFYPLIKNTVGVQRFALDIFPSSDVFYTGFVDIIGIKSGGDVQNSKNTLKKAITITHRSTDSTGGNQNAVVIDAQMYRPQISAVTRSSSGVHHITSVNADNYTSIIQAGTNGVNPIHYSAYSQRDNALAYHHYKDATVSTGILNHERNIIAANTTTFSSGFGTKTENYLLTSDASTYVNFDEETIVANVGVGTTTTARRFRHVSNAGGIATAYIMGLYASGVTIGNTTALPNTTTSLDLVGTTTGLGLNLVPTVSLPTASTRKGNMMYDSTANILKVSNGTIYQNASFTAGTASQFVKADGTIDSNNYQGTNTTEVTTSATTLTLTASSNSVQRFTGGTAQTVVMPDATTISLSRTFTFVNDSSAIVYIQRNGGSALMTLTAGATGYVTVNNISTSAGTYYSRQSDYFGTNTWTWGRAYLNYQITGISGDNGTLFTHYNEGTTGQNTTRYRYRNNDGASTTVPIVQWSCDTNGGSTYVTDRPLYSFQSSNLTTGNGNIMTMYGNRVRIHHQLVVGDGGTLSTVAPPNTATSIDMKSVTLGLGLPLVPTTSTPTASTRKGNLLFDSTVNILKVSDGTNWNTVNTGVSSAVMVGILDADQSVTTSTDISPNFVAQADPNSWFDSGTQRVTPTIAGYYNVSYSVWWGANSSTNQVNTQIRKNGNSQAIYQRLSSSVAIGFTMGGSKVVYMNGTTDYFDFVVFTSDANSIFKGNVDGSGTYFSVHLLR